MTQPWQTLHGIMAPLAALQWGRRGAAGRVARGVPRAPVTLRRRWIRVAAGLVSVLGLVGPPRAATAAPVTSVAPAAPDDPQAAAAGAEIVMRAMALLGVPYRFGGADPAVGLDCSGLVWHVFGTTFGMELPRTAERMRFAGKPVEPAALQPGDLLFFNTLRRPFSHVGIYLGEGRLLHAPARGGVVRIEPIDEPYWRQRFNGARRIEVPAAALSARRGDAPVAALAAPAAPAVPTAPARPESGAPAPAAVSYPMLKVLDDGIRGP